MLQQSGITTAAEFSESLNELSSAAGGAETEEGRIPGIWAKLIGESGYKPAEAGERAQAAATG